MNVCKTDKRDASTDHFQVMKHSLCLTHEQSQTLCHESIYLLFQIFMESVCQEFPLLKKIKYNKRKKSQARECKCHFCPLSFARCHHSWDNGIKQMLFLLSQYFFTKICHLTYGFGFSCQLIIFSLFHLNTNVLHKSQKKTWLIHPCLCVTNHFIKWLNTSWFFPLSLLGPLQDAVTPANLTKVSLSKINSAFLINSQNVIQFANSLP